MPGSVLESRAGSILASAEEVDVTELYHILRRQTHRVLSDAADEREKLQKEINLLWKPALDRLEGNSILAHHLGREFNEEELQANTFDATRNALCRLHANACLVGSEIVALLRTGHANGAEARWRSLFEITVVSEFVLRGGNGVAQRYLDHNIVKAWEDAKAWQSSADAGNRFSDEELSALQQDADALKISYGKDYLDSYGWATEALRQQGFLSGKGRATFQKLQEAVSFDILWPNGYRLASHAVHPTSKGIHFNLNSKSPFGRHALSAPSPYGVFQPGWNTSHSLFHATAILLGVDLNENRKMLLRAFERLTRVGMRHFVRAQKRMDAIPRPKYEPHSLR